MDKFVGSSGICFHGRETGRSVWVTPLQCRSAHSLPHFIRPSALHQPFYGTACRERLDLRREEVKKGHPAMPLKPATAAVFELNWTGVETNEIARHFFFW
jgi:hypothetical protein